MTTLNQIHTQEAVNLIESHKRVIPSIINKAANLLISSYLKKPRGFKKADFKNAVNRRLNAVKMLSEDKFVRDLYKSEHTADILDFLTREVTIVVMERVKFEKKNDSE